MAAGLVKKNIFITEFNQHFICSFHCLYSIWRSIHHKGFKSTMWILLLIIQHLPNLIGVIKLWNIAGKTSSFAVIAEPILLSGVRPLPFSNSQQRAHVDTFTGFTSSSGGSSAEGSHIRRVLMCMWSGGLVVMAPVNLDLAAKRGKHRQGHNVILSQVYAWRRGESHTTCGLFSI